MSNNPLLKKAYYTAMNSFVPLNVLKQSFNDFKRLDYYYDLYKNVAFVKWNDFFKSVYGLESILKYMFKESNHIIKLIGSSSTGTLRKGHEDIDLAVAFYQPFDMEYFVEKIISSNLNVFKVKKDKEYGYIKISGFFENKEFVLVPMEHPFGRVNSYEQDAFYHPDFINSMREREHSFNVLLAKTFFSQIGLYKKIKGISTELLILKYKNFDNLLKNFVDHDFMRVNFSNSDLEYSSSLLVVDYPFLGGRSFVEGIDRNLYDSIRSAADNILYDYKFLKGSVL